MKRFGICNFQLTNCRYWENKSRHLCNYKDYLCNYKLFGFVKLASVCDHLVLRPTLYRIRSLTYDVIAEIFHVLFCLKWVRVVPLKWHCWADLCSTRGFRISDWLTHLQSQICLHDSILTQLTCASWVEFDSWFIALYSMFWNFKRE